MLRIFTTCFLFSVQPLLSNVGLSTPLQAKEGENVSDGSLDTDEPGSTEVKKAPLEVIEVIGTRVGPYENSTFSTNKFEMNLLDVPQSVSIITGEIIKEHNLMKLNEIAPFAAGVSEFSSYNDFSIRGFRSKEDRRVNGLRNFNNFWSQDSIGHVERVEVIKGPASATFGDASPGGVINIVTKKPLEVKMQEVIFSAGSDGDKLFSADVTGPWVDDGNLLYRLNGTVADLRSFRNKYFEKNLTLAPSMTWFPTDATSVNLDFVNINNRSVLDRGQPNIKGASRLDYVPINIMVTQPGDYFNTSSNTLTLNISQELTADWSLASSLVDSRYEEDLFEHRYTDHVSESVIELAALRRKGRAGIQASSTWVTGVVDSGTIEHKILFGFDRASRITTNKIDRANSIATFDVLNPTYVERDISLYEFESWENGGKLLTRGVYAQNHMTRGDLQLLLGTRLENFTSQPDDEDSRKTSDLVSRLGIVYELSSTASLYASFIEGFEPPDTEINIPEYGGPFEALESVLAEIGTKAELLDSRLFMTASVYEIIKRNIVVWANDPNNPDLYYQRGEERSRGIEWEANGKLSSRFRLLLNFSHNDARVTKDENKDKEGDRKIGAPLNAAATWLKYNSKNGLGFGLGFHYVDQRKTFDDDLNIPEYLIYNASLFYKTDSIDVNLSGKNLTNKIHWTGGYNYGRMFPGRPLTFELSARWKI